MKRMVIGVVLGLTLLPGAGLAQRAAVLRDVKAIQVDPTVIANPRQGEGGFRSESDAGFVKERVRDNLMWSSYQGGNTQRSQATNSFDRRLMEEIARLK